MKSGEYDPVRMAYPGRRTRVALRIAKGLFFILLTAASLISGLPVHSQQAPNAQNANDSGNTSMLGNVGTQLPRSVGADPVPDLSLPKTVRSSVDGLIGAGGVIQASPQNITLYNLGVKIRLLGGSFPRDEFLDRGQNVLSSRSFWKVEAEAGNGWILLRPVSSDFTLLGTNQTGTFVVRTMKVQTAAYSGTLGISYEASSAGPLKWDLQFTPATSNRYRLVYDWWNLTNVVDLSTGSKRFGAGFPSGNYTFSWRDVQSVFDASASLIPGQFSLRIDLGQIIGGSSVEVDPSVVGTSIDPGATYFSFQRKVIYEPDGDRYWVFFYDGYTVKYSNSTDGAQWSTPQQMPVGWPQYSSYQFSSPTVFNSGRNIVVASGSVYFKANAPSGTTGMAGIAFVMGTISGPRVSWGQVYNSALTRMTCDNGGSACANMMFGYMYVSVTIGGDGSLAFSGNLFKQISDSNLCPTGSYEESAVVVVYRGNQLVADRDYGCSLFLLPRCTSRLSSRQTLSEESA